MLYCLYRLRQGPTNLLILVCLLVFIVFYLYPLQSFSQLDYEKLSSQLHGTRIYHDGHVSGVSSPAEPQTVGQLCSPSTVTYTSETRTSTVTKVRTTTVTENVSEPTGRKKASNKVVAAVQSLEEQTITKLREAGIVIVFKTGAQEVSSFSIQVGTTLRYLTEREILFFSDQQGSIGPFTINDALRNVNESIRMTSPDFEIYRSIRRYQSTGQDIEKLKENLDLGDGRSGWQLDKYKFIHMVEEAFQMRPNAKWYVFMETDSYIVWNNLVEWLSALNPTKPLYLGAAVFIGDTAFGHGGSGYVLSSAAMNRLLGPEQPQGLAAKWDLEMHKHCCGDLALALALKDKGINVQGAHPLLNGLKPTTLTYGPFEHWCQPVVTMHHVLPHEVSSIWRFERRREQIHGNSNVSPI
nr:hypothetical protein [uncultured organism]